MAGTTLDRKLTGARRGGVTFAVAAQSDDPDIRRLLRENPMRGAITLSLEREPDYFADAAIPGTDIRTIVIRYGGRTLCTGYCSIRRRFVNGQSCRVGYLGGLRLDSHAAGRFDILRRGYDFFRELETDQPADFYFTSIASDNVAARRFLERGIRGMPEYEFVGDFVTAFLPVASSCPRSDSMDNSCFGSPELLEFVNKCGRNYQFRPHWSAEESGPLSTLGLRRENTSTVCDKEHLGGVANLWDQHRFKQTVIRNYQPWLRLTRPALNLAAGILGKPRLPAVGSRLAYAFVSQLAIASDNPDYLVTLARSLRFRAAHLGVDFIALGFASNDPLLAAIRNTFWCREYSSRIYVVRWPGLGGAARDLDGRCLGPEVALL